MPDFTNKSIRLDVLKERAFNMRWAEVEEGVIPLTAADTDFMPPPEISQALIEYIQGGYFPYVPKLGMPELKESIARSLYERKQERIDPDLILPIDSAARGMFVIAQAMLQPGDEMLIFDPVDFLFRESALSAGAVPVCFPARIKDGAIDLTDLEKYITPKTRMIGLCNPHNPLGMTYSLQDLQTILDLAEKYDLWIMNDEIWSDIIYTDSVFTSILTLDHTERVLSVYGFSKAFGIAGLRAGCIYCESREAFEKIVQASDVLTTAGGISSLSQVAAMACVDKCYYWVDAFCRHLTENRDYALERIEQMPLIECYKPQAVFVLFPDVSQTGMSAEALCSYLREEEKLALVPGGAQYFGPGSEGHVRICISTSREILKEGLDRLERGLKKLQAEKTLTNQ